MVRFLLHNTLGAWWAGKLLGAARVGCAKRRMRLLARAPARCRDSWDYLRFVCEEEVLAPGCGDFPGWPSGAAEITLLDPCCGSGHFLTEALAGSPRCAERKSVCRLPMPSLPCSVTICMGWRSTGAACRSRLSRGADRLAHRRLAEIKLPTPHVAWVGAPPPLPKSEFVALANGDGELERARAPCTTCFVQAPLLGSLIEPGRRSDRPRAGWRASSTASRHWWKASARRGTGTGGGRDRRARHGGRRVNTRAEVGVAGDECALPADGESTQVTCARYWSDCLRLCKTDLRQQWSIRMARLQRTWRNYRCSHQAAGFVSR